jgi:hypothetical protein
MTNEIFFFQIVCEINLRMSSSQIQTFAGQPLTLSFTAQDALSRFPLNEDRAQLYVDATTGEFKIRVNRRGVVTTAVVANSSGQLDATEIADGSVSNTSFQRLSAVAGPLVSTTASQTLTNKTLTSPIVTSFVNGSGSTVLVPPGLLGGPRTLATLTFTETLTNKTLTEPKIMTLNNISGAVITTPRGSGDRTLATITGTETLTNKTLTSPTITGFTMSTFVNGSGATITVPTGNTARTLATLNGVETFNNKFFPVASEPTTIIGWKNGAGITIVSPTHSSGISYTLTTDAGAETLTNKTIGSFYNTDLTPALISTPTGTGNRTLATITGTETLTNKTLTSPTMTLVSTFTNGSGATITVPTGNTARTLATLNKAESFTNKTINGVSNTISNISIAMMSSTLGIVTGSHTMTCSQLNVGADSRMRWSKMYVASGWYAYNCDIYLEWTTHGASAATVEVSIPVAHVNSSNTRGVGTVSWVTGIAFTNQLVLHVAQSASTFIFGDLSKTTGTTTASLARAAFDNAGTNEMFGRLFYFGIS